MNNTELIKSILSLGTRSNDLIDIFFVVSKLTKKYGKILYNKKYIDEISNKYKNISNILLMLKITNNMKYEDLKNLLQLTKKYAIDYTPKFTISSDSKNHNELIKKHINEKFGDSEINMELKEKIGIYISGEGRYYKKDLHSDIEKILS